MEQKKCKKCNVEKDITEFYKDKSYKGKDYLKPSCKICCNKQKNMHYALNAEYYKEHNRTYAKSEGARERRKAIRNHLWRTDPIFKMQSLYRGRLQKALIGLCRSKKSEEILGCTWEEFKIFLENKFLDGMTWENHGLYGWHVDHIIPLASAKTLIDIEKLSHYTNLQPLWAKDNYAKGTS